jgi:adenine phosphoribosyltransferase
MTSTRTDITYLQSLIRDVPDVPKPGILYKDITPLLADRRGFAMAIDWVAQAFQGEHIDVVVGVESRGFIFGAAAAYALGAGFVPSRKPKKLPSKVIRVDYELEYGTDAMEMHHDAISPGQSVLVVDDVLATGGTAHAVGQLLKQLDANLVGYAFIIELTALHGAPRLAPHAVRSLLRF